jgi:hypothetical protein
MRFSSPRSQQSHTYLGFNVLSGRLFCKPISARHCCVSINLSKKCLWVGFEVPAVKKSEAIAKQCEAMRLP